jgi:hypothetical protein
MLSDEQKEYLIKYHENHEKAEKKANSTELANMRQMNMRIKDKALNMIQDLILIAQIMPEKEKEKMFTKDCIRLFVSAILNDSENYNTIGLFDDERRQKLPEPIYNSRIFDLGVLFANVGIETAYNMISWKSRIKDNLRRASKGEKMELIEAMAIAKGMYEKKTKGKK